MKSSSLPTTDIFFYPKPATRSELNSFFVPFCQSFLFPLSHFLAVPVRVLACVLIGLSVQYYATQQNTKLYLRKEYPHGNLFFFSFYCALRSNLFYSWPRSQTVNDLFWWNSRPCLSRKYIKDESSTSSCKTKLTGSLLVMISQAYHLIFSVLLKKPQGSLSLSRSCVCACVCRRGSEWERKFYDAPEQDCGDTSCIFIGNEIDWLAN